MTIHRDDAHAGVEHPEVEVVVGLDSQTAIKVAVADEESAAVEHGLMVDEVAPDGGRGTGAGVTASIFETGFADHDFGVCLIECAHGVGENRRAGEAIIGPEEKKPVATGGGDAFVHRVIDAGVGLGNEGGEAVALGLEPLAGAVGGSAVDDDEFGVGVALGPHAFQRGAKAGSGVFADDNHTDAG